MKAFSGPDEQILFFRPEENVRRFNRSARRMLHARTERGGHAPGDRRAGQAGEALDPQDPRGRALHPPAMIASEVGLGVRPPNSISSSSSCRPWAPTSAGLPPGEPPVSSTTCGPWRAESASQDRRQLRRQPAASARRRRRTATRSCGSTPASGSTSRKWRHEHLLRHRRGDHHADARRRHPGGITRKSVLQLASHLGYAVAERKIPIAELVKASPAAACPKVFGVGTAASIAPVGAIVFPRPEPRRPRRRGRPGGPASLQGTAGHPVRGEGRPVRLEPVVQTAQMARR